MKISIITASKNNSETLQRSFDSIKEQTYQNIEYIVVDSSDEPKSLKIIKDNQKIISKLIYQKPKGIYNALNTGIENSTGDIIGFLHSDDIFYDKNVISLIVDNFRNNKINALYGNIILESKKYSRIWSAGDFELKKFKKGWHPPHTSLFILRDTYIKNGLYNTNYKISSDFELIIRYFFYKKIKLYYLNHFITKMKIGGASTNSFKSVIDSNYEVYKILSMYNFKFPTFIIMRKIILKIFQITFRK